MAQPLTGQVTASGTAQSLDPNFTSVNCAAFTIKAPSTNAAALYIGSKSVTLFTGYPLLPGEEFEYQRMFNNVTPTLQLTPADIYVVGSSPDTAAWFATP